MIKHFANFGILGAFALVSSAALVACGDDSSSGIFSMEKSFEMVLDKAKYDYNKKDSTFKRIEPVCKEGTLGNLVGPAEADMWDTLTYKAYENKGIVTILKGKDVVGKYNLSDGTFPRGFWGDEDNTSKKIQGGFRLTKKNVMNRVIRYDGSCFMKDYYSVFNKEVNAIENIDAKLKEFYGRFQTKEGPVDDKQMLADIRAIDCDELSLYDGLVKIRVQDFKESKGRIVISYDKRSCNVDFHLRYAFEQQDCEAAYADYKDSKSKETFDFNDFFFDVTYSGNDEEYCLDYLILDLKKEKGIPTTKSIQPKEFARGIVNLMIGGMK
jgi:hypothetical protein